MSDNNSNNDPILDALLNDKALPVEVQETKEDEKETATETATQTTAAAETEVKSETSKEPGQAAAQPGDWISEASKSIGHDFKSPEELKELVNKGKSYGDLESRSTTLTQELESLKTAQPVDPFANDYIKKLNELTKAGAPPEQVKLFTEINSLDVKALSPVEAKELALRYEHGLTAEEAKNMINSMYKLDPEVYEKAIVDAENVRLKVESKKDAEYLEKLQTNAAINPAETQQAEYAARIEEYAKKVEPIAKSIQESLTAIKGVNLNGKQGEDAILIDLPVSEETRAKLTDVVTQYAVQNNIPLTNEGTQHLKEFAENLALIDNWKSMAIDIASKTEERIRAEFHNPSSIQRGIDNPADNKAAQELATQEWVIENS